MVFDQCGYWDSIWWACWFSLSFFAGDSISLCECVLAFFVWGEGMYMRINGRKIREVLDRFGWF